MARIIAIASAKGGVGKTTTSVNLAASLAIAEKRVLLIDMDPAGSTSRAFSTMDQENINAGLFEIFTGSVDAPEAIHPVKMLDIDLIPINVKSSEQESRLMEMAKNRIRLKRQLSSMETAGKLSYDYIIIDTPPSLNDLTIGALIAANSVLIPLQCGYFSLNGAERLFELIGRVRKSINPELEIEGILLNFYEKGTRVSIAAEREAQKHFKPYMFDTVIPKNAALGHAEFERKPLSLVDVNAPGAKAYLSLAEEILDRNAKPIIELLPDMPIKIETPFAS